MEPTTSELKIWYTGWALKLGSHMKNWKRRWFVLLSDGTLRYFPDKTTYQEKGHIMIDRSTMIKVEPATPEGVPLSIVRKERTFLMRFPEVEEAQRWSVKFIEVATFHGS